jgi:hypothetical protein
MSYFMEVTEMDATEDAAIFTGQRSNGQPELCRCPNCAEPMFPAFTIRRDIPGMPDADIYDENGFATLDVCASCSHSLKNYYTKVDGAKRTAHLGYVDGLGPSNYIDTPYGSRAVAFIDVAHDQWQDAAFAEKYMDRCLLNGVLHQLGGEKMRDERVPLAECMCCGGNLTYFGTVDYDDLNMPIYEGGEPLALVIGDMRSLNVFLCDACSALNYGITC